MRPADLRRRGFSIEALRRLAHGADALVVSNHGGRQLDGAPGRIEPWRRSSRRSMAASDALKPARPDVAATGSR